MVSFMLYNDKYPLCVARNKKTLFPSLIMIKKPASEAGYGWLCAAPALAHNNSVRACYHLLTPLAWLKGLLIFFKLYSTNLDFWNYPKSLHKLTELTIADTSKHSFTVCGLNGIQM